MNPEEFPDDPFVAPEPDEELDLDIDPDFNDNEE